VYVETLATARCKAHAAATALDADEAGAEVVAEARAVRLQAARIDEQVLLSQACHSSCQLPAHVQYHRTVLVRVIVAGEGYERQAGSSTAVGC
jgi:hypothetical protein